jgi:hypothetical protein
MWRFLALRLAGAILLRLAEISAADPQELQEQHHCQS